MADVVPISRRADLHEILDEVLERDDVEECMVIYSYRDKRGAMQWAYGHTRGESRMAMVGALQWVSDELIHGGGD